MNGKNTSPAPKKKVLPILIAILLLAGLGMIYTFNRPTNNQSGNYNSFAGNIPKNNAKIDNESKKAYPGYIQNDQETDGPNQKANKQESAVSGEEYLVFENNSISSQASFYAYNSDGVQMEVLAARASDGTIRTAFNTCQVCYDSGRGYYVQEGDQLICQNCGNRFDIDDVEKIRGGCNPVPILPENKSDDGTRTTVTKSFLDQNKDLFINWKKG